MFLDRSNLMTDHAAGLLGAATAAAAAIPPAFPLAATVAVSPFLGQTDDDLPQAAARLTRVAGLSPIRPREDIRALVAAGRISDDDLAATLIACTSPLKPVDLATLKLR